MNTVDTIVIVGGGPRTTGLLLSIAARLRCAAVAPELDIHIVDPYPVGPGRIWRSDQPGQVWMNNTTDQMTVYADGDPQLVDSATTAPIDGPTIADWVGDSGVFVPRRDVATYLRDAFDRAVDSLPVTVTVTEHRATAVSACAAGESRLVRLDDGTALRADVTVLAQGHLDMLPEVLQQSGHTPPGYTVDQDFSHLPAGKDVLVRGFGLAFIDLMMMLTEGRGGRFEFNGGQTDGHPVPEYHPSGDEPVLWVGSRRGVPYRSKLVDGPPRITPRYLNEDVLARLPRTADGVFVGGILRSLLHAELTDAWYTTLSEFDAARIAVTTAKVHSLVDRWVERLLAGDRPGADAHRVHAQRVLEGAVADPADLLDLRRLNDPLAEREFGSVSGREQAVEDIVVTNLRRVLSRRFPQDGALYSTLVTAFGTVASLSFGGDLSEADQRCLSGLASTFSYVCSGPPPERLGNLVALHRAGIVRFLGADVDIRESPAGSVHRYAAGKGVHTVTADYLVDARLAALRADRVSDSLLSDLLVDGEIMVRSPGESASIAVDDRDRAVGVDGTVRSDLFLIGPMTSSPVREGFGRPGEATRLFPANDALAVAVLDATSFAAVTPDASATRSKALRSTRS